MYGSMIGDIVGSQYKFHNTKTKDFPLFTKECMITDNSITTAASVSSILICRDAHFCVGYDDLRKILTDELQKYAKQYPNPLGGYGTPFEEWLENPKPCHSCDNGAAKRASPFGSLAVIKGEVLILGRIAVSVTHDHPESKKGTLAVAATVF